MNNPDEIRSRIIPILKHQEVEERHWINVQLSYDRIANLRGEQ